MIRQSIAAFFVVALTSVLACAETQGPAFCPATSPGSVYTGSFEAEAILKVNIDAPGGWGDQAAKAINGSGYAMTEYRHQTIDASEAGICRSAVRNYKKSALNIEAPNRNQKGDAGLQGRRYFVTGPDGVSIRPKNELTPEAIGLVLIDLDDPFRPLLPKEELRHGLVYSPDEKDIKDFYAKVNKVIDAKSTAEIPLQFADIKGRVSVVGITKATISIKFDGKLVVPLGAGKTFELPFTGSIDVTYDLDKKCYLDGKLNINGDGKGKFDFGGVSVPYSLNYRMTGSFTRNPGDVLAAARGLKGKTVICEPIVEDPPLLLPILSDKLYLLAAWDGSGAFEVMNRGAAFAGVTDAPTAAGISPDTKSVLLACGKKLFESSDFGDTFAPLKWAGSGIRNIWYLNSPNPVALIECDDNSYFLLNLGAAKSVKPLPPPISGKKILNACPGPGREEIYIAIQDEYWLSVEGGKASKLSGGPKKTASLMRPHRAGVFVFTEEGIFDLSQTKCVSICAKSIPSVIGVTSSSDTLFVRDSQGDVFAVPLSGGVDPTKTDTGVLALAARYNKLFFAKADSFEVRDSAPKE
ncbi:MAG: hypothetical protein WC712_00260 [Candidatus Brocadiia bacterium]